MDDGSKSNNGFHAPRSQSFTKPEVELLVRTLKINFNLDCTIHNNRGPVIYIRTSSMNQFRSLAALQRLILINL